MRLEFHCHTIYSPDSLTKPEALLKACARKGIDRVVVTDHNTIRGALEARKIDPQRVIVGEEIMTQQGELLAAYVQEEVPKGLPALEAIAALRDQGAFISVSHPFDITRRGHARWVRRWRRNGRRRRLRLPLMFEVLFTGGSLVPLRIATTVVAAAAAPSGRLRSALL